MPEYSFAALFLVGLLGGGHCVGMCGGIVTALQLQLPARRARWPFLLGYNAGRLTSYTLIGLLVGAVGGLGLETLGTRAAQTGLYLFANLLLLMLGLYLAGLSTFVTRIEKLGRPLWARLQPVMRALLPIRSVGHSLLVGALWGWIPCGLVYSASLSALASGSALHGAGLMLAFGLGTLPNLLAMGAFADMLRHALQRRPVRLAAGLSICALALWRLWQALG